MTQPFSKAVQRGGSWRIKNSDGSETGWFMTKAQAEHSIEKRAIDALRVSQKESKLRVVEKSC